MWREGRDRRRWGVWRVAVALGLAALSGLAGGAFPAAIAQEPTTPTRPPVVIFTATPRPGDGVPDASPGPTRTPTLTPTATPSATPSPTPSATATATPTVPPTPTPAAPAVTQYGLFELDVPVGEVSATATVMAHFSDGANGRLAVPGFWMQPHRRTCNQDCSVELIDPVGDPVWRVRFNPPTAGRWTYRIEVNDGGSTRVTAQGTFTAAPARGGIIRVGENRRYFAREDGTPFFPVGINLGWSWSGARGTFGYQEWLRQLAEVGGNYARLYVDVPWFIGLGWRAPVNALTSIQEDAWKLDTVLQTAEQYGIALQIVLVWHQGWGSYGGLPVIPPSDPARPNMAADWFSNPHNRQLGGAYANAAQFFETREGRELFRARLRYIVARWGYSSSVFAWEIIDQLDRIVTGNPPVAVDWLQEMAAYLRDIDPYRHPITAGVRDPARLSLLDPVVLDFAQVRYYQRAPVETPGDQVLGALSLLTPLLQSADRPVLMNEFSLGPWFEPAAQDPTGTHILTTMWASALSGAGGAAASWWWDTYLFPHNLVSGVGPLAAFVSGIPWDSADLRPISLRLMGGEAISYAPLRVSGFNGTFGYVPPPDSVFRLTQDGINPPAGGVPSYLYGTVYSTQFSQPQTYIITPPVDTRLIVNVSRTADRGGARLVVIVNGQTTAEMQLAPNSSAVSLIVPLRAGENRVVLDNLGADFLQLDSMEVEAYISPLRALALADREQGILVAWLQHREYTWQHVAAGVTNTPISATIGAAGMPVGVYLVELWDPFTGNVVGQEYITVAGTNHGELRVELLPISQMLAVRAIRIAEPGDMPSPTPTPSPTPRLAASPTPASGG